MKKEQKPFFEKMEFNDALYAKTVLEKETKKLEKAKRGLIVALIATVLFTIFGNIGGFEEGSIQQTIVYTIAFGSLILGLISYIIGGGLKLILGLYIHIVLFVWRAVPFLFFDFCAAIIVAFLGFVCFLFLPVVYAGINYLTIRMRKKEAEEYLSFCTPVK